MNKYINAISANLVFFTINTLFFLVITPLSIRVMGEEFFGLWSILYALMVFSNIGTLGIGSIVNKFAAENHIDGAKQEYFSQVITAGILIVIPMATLVALVLLLTRNLIATNLAVQINLQAEFSNALLLVAGSIFPQFLSRIPRGFLLSQLKNRTVSQIDVLSSILLWTGAVLIVVTFGKHISMLGLWCLVNSTLVLILYFRAMKKYTKLALYTNVSLIQKMLNFSGFMFIESVANAAFQNLDRVIVGITLGPAMAGVYSVGTSIGLRMSLVVGQVTAVMVPYASLKDSISDHPRLLIVFRRMSRYISIIVAGLGGLAIIWMADILSLWISPDYALRYSDAFRLLIWAYSLLSLCRSAHQSLIGIGKVRFSALVYFISTTVTLSAVFALSDRVGLYGAVLANFFMVILLTYNIYMYRFLDERNSYVLLFSDLRWGLLIPPITYAIILFIPSLLAKVLTTVALVVILIFILHKDEWVHKELLTLLRWIKVEITAFVNS